jgi:membrane-associated phospholipid phosphatase
VTLSLAHAWLAPLLLPLAAAVTVSRVRLRVHHASDVVAGAALGVAGALTAAALLSTIPLPEPGAPVTSL